VTASIVPGEAVDVDAVDDAGDVHDELPLVDAGYRAVAWLGAAAELARSVVLS
jgi:hypothetical protein